MSQTLRDVLVNGSGVEREFLCPVHGDTRPSASVNVLKGLWYCYTCGAKGNLEGVDGEVDHLEILQGMIDLAKRAATPRPTYTEAWLNLWDAGDPHPYWLSRFSARAVKHFRLGYDSEANAVTYPLRSASGRVLGVVRRPLDTDGGPKYKYPYGVDVSELLFNFDFEARPRVFLVEGALDAIACWEVGVTNVFAIYGARMSAAQLQLLNKIDCSEIVCAFDLDPAGFRAFEQVCELASDKMVTQITWPAAWGKDVAELDPERRRAVLGGLDQLGQTREDLVDSSPWNSRSEALSPSEQTTLRVRGGRTPSRTTSKLGGLRIVPPRT